MIIFIIFKDMLMKNLKKNKNSDEVIKKFLSHKHISIEDKITTIKAVNKFSSSRFSQAIKSLLKK